MSKEARVYRVYNDEAVRKDAEETEGMQKHLDTQIIFVSVFI